MQLGRMGLAVARQPLSFVGTADAVRAGSVDLVVTNISPEAIIALAPELMRTLRAGGVAIVSGFEQAEVAGVEAALAANGARVRESHDKNGWSVVVGVKGKSSDWGGNAGQMPLQRPVPPP